MAQYKVTITWTGDMDVWHTVFANEVNNDNLLSFIASMAGYISQDLSTTATEETTVIVFDSQENAEIATILLNSPPQTVMFNQSRFYRAIMDNSINGNMTVTPVV